MSQVPSRRSLLAAGVALPTLAVPTIGRTQPRYKPEYKITVVANRPVALSEGAFVWADLVNQRSQGRLNFKVYPGSALVGGDQTRELLAMRQGVIDAAVFSTINISPQIREMNLFSLPFLMPGPRAYDALIEGEVGRDLFRVLAQREVEPIAWGENGFREISNSKRQIRAPADLRGLKIRFAAGAIFSEIYSGLHANPVQMSFADLQPALSTGAVDGQENPVNLFLGFRMDTLAQKHLSIWNYCADAGIFAVAKQVMTTFTPQDREIVVESAREAARVQIAGARKGLGLDGDHSAIQECERRGVSVVALSDAEKRAFAQATRPVFDKWAQTVGTDLVRRAETAIARVG
jgi:TRAP-type C4-dicarboxylate transport system substrate-binding protein